ncbi:unnamed protein product [Rotaria magnacalcarata]
MSRNGTYADYLAVSAAAVIVNKNILIHELGKKPLFIPGSYYIDDQLHICYYPDKLHYNSVVDAIGNTAILPSEAIVFTWPILFLLITIIFLFNHYYYYYYYYLTILSFFEHSFFNTYNTNLLKFIIILFFLFLSIYYLMSKFSIYQTSSQTSLLYVILLTINMENITGYIVDLAGEKRGPVKFYKRFTIITTEQEKISGWIFSSSSFTKQQ